MFGKAKKFVKKQFKSGGEKKILERMQHTGKDIQDLKKENLLKTLNKEKQKLAEIQDEKRGKIAEKYSKKVCKLRNKYQRNVHLLQLNNEKKWELKKVDLEVEQEKELRELKNRREIEEDEVMKKFSLKEKLLEQKYEKKWNKLIKPFEEEKVETSTERSIENCDYIGDGSGSENGDKLSENMDEEPIARQSLVNLIYQPKFVGGNMHFGIGNNLTEKRDSEQEKTLMILNQGLEDYKKHGPYIDPEEKEKFEKKIKNAFRVLKNAAKRCSPLYKK